MKVIKVIVTVLLLFVVTLLCILIWLVRPITVSEDDINILSPQYLIAHGGGGIDGKTYTNCKEALISSLDKGFRYVELDLYMTSDSDVVCLHHISDFNMMTSSHYDSLDQKTFLESQFYGKYTPMSLEDAIKIWEERPFIFVTDKISDPQVLNRYFKKHRERVFVEAFSIDDYWQLEKDGYTPMFSIMAMNVRGLARYLKASFKSRKMIKRIVTNSDVSKYTLRIFKRLGVEMTAIYSLDDEDYWRKHEKSYLEKYIGREVDLVYTDYLTPRE